MFETSFLDDVLSFLFYVSSHSRRKGRQEGHLDFYVTINSCIKNQCLPFLRHNNARNDTVILRVFIPSIYNALYITNVPTHQSE